MPQYDYNPKDLDGFVKTAVDEMIGTCLTAVRCRVAVRDIKSSQGVGNRYSVKYSSGQLKYGFTANNGEDRVDKQAEVRSVVQDLERALKNPQWLKFVKSGSDRNSAYQIVNIMRGSVQDEQAPCKRPDGCFLEICKQPMDEARKEANERALRGN